MNNEEDPEYSESTLRYWLVLILALPLIVYSLPYPNFLESRGPGTPEHLAKGQLRTLHSAQEAYLKKYGRYGDLKELGKAGYVDEVLAAGRKYGYQYRCEPGAEPEYVYWISASPVELELGSSIYYGSNHSGELIQSERPLHLDKESCQFRK